MSVTSPLPNLLYAADVPVESTLAGAALLFRLLSTWPAERLRVVQPGAATSSHGRRLKGVEYRETFVRFPRLLHTRLAPWRRGRLFRAAQRGGPKLIRTAGARDFRPDAVLTVAHDKAWRAADDAARRLGVPLHLIVHDEPVTAAQLPASMAEEARAAFADVYRRAASRMCVSPYMAERFEKEFGVRGEVIYPSRAPGAPVFDAPPQRVAEVGRPLTYGYAGSVNSPAYAESLAALAAAAGRRGDRLRVFSNLAAGSEARLGLTAPHVRASPIVPFLELIDILRRDVDVLYVPMSFEPMDRPNMELSFPSKLTDYTAVGLPLLIRGPAYCSAARWAAENPGAAAVVGDLSPDALDAALASLADPSRRMDLARGAVRLGAQFFSHEAVFGKFAALLRAGAPGGAPAAQRAGPAPAGAEGR